MQEATQKITPGGSHPPFKPDIIDIDAHVDRDLLKLCACLVRMRGQLQALERCIEAIPAHTAEARRMKALSL